MYASDPQIFTIESIRNRTDNTPHEREARRKDHAVRIEWLAPGDAMLYVYTDGSGGLRTSRVVEAVYTDDGWLRVTTMNTVYIFRKVAA